MNHIPLSVMLFLVVPSSVLAAESMREDDDKGIFNVIIENDIFAGSDSDYTNGIRFSWLSSEDHMPGWVQSVAKVLPIAGGGNKRISIAVGQSMFAPEDLSRRDLVISDQPYAGWLYGSVGMVSDTGKTLDNVLLTIGVVGSYSLAEPVQKFVHCVVDSPPPNGWEHQLKNEPGIMLTYERKWRAIAEASPFGVGVDVTPHVGINLGNVNTDVTVGATFRLGYDLPSDYGSPRIRPSLPGSDFFIPTQDLGGYLFATIGERAVVRNIFLDGNTFIDGPGVDKKNLVTSLQVGAAVTYHDMRLSYAQVFMTKEYSTQKHPSVFGALTLSHRF